MATVTASAAQSVVQPKFIHAGVYSMSARHSFSASVGDVIQMVKVPSGFQVQEVILNTVTSAGVGIITLGDGLDTNRFVSGSVGSTMRLGQGLAGAELTAPFVYTVVDTVDVVVTALATPDLLTIGLTVMGSVDN